VGRRFVTPSGDVVDAVRDASLAVARGTFVALAGPSGSGKTTLLHLLAAVDTPTSGTVTVEGRDVRALTPAARADLRLTRIGLVFAEDNLSPALTVGENVDLPLALRGLPRRERARRVAATLERVGIGHLVARFPDALSSGEEQRAAVARALAGEPALVVLDEPTSHLDTAAAAALTSLLAELVRERDVAVLVASHDERLLERVDRVIRLADGRVEEST
jgi:putative ABC transport system ATP-binding protein